MKVEDHPLEEEEERMDRGMSEQFLAGERRGEGVVSRDRGKVQF